MCSGQTYLIRYFLSLELQIAGFFDRKLAGRLAQLGLLLLTNEFGIEENIANLMGCMTIGAFWGARLGLLPKF